MIKVRSKLVITIGIWLLNFSSNCPCLADQDTPILPSVSQRRARTAIIVHRGSLDLAVENTLAAIEASFLTGADGVEIDIAQTSDGELILMHDPWIDRVLDGFGNVGELTYDDLLAMRFRDPYGLTRAKEHVPTLRQALELIDHYNGLIHLDIKVPEIDSRVHALLVELDLLENVVTVNDYNSTRVREDSRLQLLPSQGALIHGNNDYDARSVREHLARRPQGTFLVDDARCAAALLDRQSPRPIDQIVLKQPLPGQSRVTAVEEESSIHLMSLLQQSKPVQQFEVDDNQSREQSVVIRRRASVAKALGRVENADEKLLNELESMIWNRSLHVDGAWQGLDGSEAVQALAAIRPDARTVDRLDQVVQRIDPRLAVIEKREELPTWLRQSGAWWDFRIKTEAIAALGRIGSPQARLVLWQLLKQPAEQAERKWRELHWDAARALTAGAWQLTHAELDRLLRHTTSGVRRAGCVYLARHHERQEYRQLVREYLPWWQN